MLSSVSDSGSVWKIDETELALSQVDFICSDAEGVYKNAKPV